MYINASSLKKNRKNSMVENSNCDLVFSFGPHHFTYRSIQYYSKQVNKISLTKFVLEDHVNLAGQMIEVS